MRRTILAAFVVAALGACSSSTGPSTPSLLGTWRVKHDILLTGQGAISPDSFNITLAVGANDSTLKLTMPTLTWSGNGGGTATFDSTNLPALSYTRSPDTLAFGEFVGASNAANCLSIAFIMTFNTAKDTATGTVIINPSSSSGANGCYNGSSVYQTLATAVKR